MSNLKVRTQGVFWRTHLCWKCS